MKNKKSKSTIAIWVIMLLITFFTGGRSCAQDYLVGDVLSLDRSRLEITLVPLTSSKAVQTAPGTGSVFIRIAEVNNLPRHEKSAALPACVVVGKTIRLWGQQKGTEGNVFIATDIRGCRGSGCSSDPTGVRARLLKSRNQKPSFTGHDDREAEPDGFGGGRGNGSRTGSGGNGSGGNGGGGGGGGGGGR